MLKSNLKALLAKGDIENTIVLLCETITKDNDWKDGVINISQRFFTFKNNIHKGHLSKDQQGIEDDKFIKAILTLINEMPDDAALLPKVQNGLNSFLIVSETDTITSTKPQNILDLEKLLQIELKERSSDGVEDFIGVMSKSFKRNKNNEVIELCLWLCKLIDISFLENFPHLQSLYLSDNNLQYIGELKTLPNLWILDLRNNAISDISPLQNLVNLYSLNLNSNQITDISPLQNLVNLTNLSAIENQITDISPLQSLTNLINLDLGFNQISDISVVANLTNLTDLWLNANEISDISAVQNLTNLTDLQIHRNPIVDIMPLQNLTNLYQLNLNSTKITNLAPIQSLIQLEKLRLFENKITDISPLQNSINLKELYLQNNQISDITALQNLKELEKLHIDNNKIWDVRPILGLEKIRQIEIDVNPIEALLPENWRDVEWSETRSFLLQYKDNWAGLRKKILFVSENYHKLIPQTEHDHLLHIDFFNMPDMLDDIFDINSLTKEVKTKKQL